MYKRKTAVWMLYHAERRFINKEKQKGGKIMKMKKVLAAVLAGTMVLSLLRHAAKAAIPVKLLKKAARVEKARSIRSYI